MLDTTIRHGRHRLETAGLIAVTALVKVARRNILVALFVPGRHRARKQVAVPLLQARRCEHTRPDRASPEPTPGKRFTALQTWRDDGAGPDRVGVRTPGRHHGLVEIARRVAQLGQR